MTGARSPLLALGIPAWVSGIAAWLAYAAGARWWLAVAGLAVAPAAALLVPAERRALAVLVAAAGVAGAAAVSIHLSATRPEPLRDWSADGAQVAAEVVVKAVHVTRPEEIGSQPRVRAVVGSVWIRHGDQVVGARSPLVLLGPAADLAGAARGARLVVEGTLLPEQPAREPGFALRVDRVLRLEPPHSWAAAVGAA